MSDNVGLTTPRGSGTSGYVQRNLSHLRPRDNLPPRHIPGSNSSTGPSPLNPNSTQQATHAQRQPDQGILLHEQRRAIEAKVFELRVKLEDQAEEEGGSGSSNGAELDEDEIEARCEALRTRLVKEQEDGLNMGAGGGGKREYKSHQVHEMARDKIAESERLRRALGISADYEEGTHWRKQEEAKAEREGRGTREGMDGRDDRDRDERDERDLKRAKRDDRDRR